MPIPTTLSALSLLLLPPSAPQQEPSPAAEEFAAVRSVLTEHCLRCHGGEHRKSELSFANADTFHEGGSRGPVIDGDDGKKSRLLEVIEYGNPELAMPKSGAMPDEDVAILRDWILAGAAWPAGEDGQLADPAQHPLEDHRVEADASWWAYGPLAQEPAPPVADERWSQHPVDAWIYAGVEEANQPHGTQASPGVLLRRATFSLTGLPPTPSERQAFAAAIEAHGWDAAWSELLDRLFASPHYGEAQARHWLDLVRYGETDGYERDSQKRNIWRYRDWIIRAYDRDLPYDRFVQLQLAGDEYAADITDPFEAADAQLATGFYRVGLFDDEPADRAQAASDDRADIVDTASQVIFGTTMGCARCHDHKADPVTQREYFALTAHFAGVTRYSKDGTRDLPDRPGEGVWTVEEHAARLSEFDRSIEEEVERAGLGPAILVEEPITLVPDAPSGGHGWRYRVSDKFDADQDWTAPSFDDADWKTGRSGFGAPGTKGAQIQTEWREPFIQLRTTFRLDAIPPALRLSAQYDDDTKVYLNGQLIFERQGYITEYRGYQLDQAALDALVVGRNVLAVECLQAAGGQSIDVGLSTHWDVDAEGGRLASLRKSLDANRDDPALAVLRRLYTQRSRHLTEPTAAPYPAHVAYERGATPPEQFVELRGSVHARGERVEPALPAAWLVGQAPDAPDYVIPTATDGSPSSLRRKALADWAFTGGAHITSRVAANRTWQFLFGRGLCRSSGDFGRLGEAPTHPELLDRVALELQHRDWSIKSLQRWLMESRTYQMTSERDVLAAASDPRNDGYSAFDPRRLTAEEYRDATLATSGELNPSRFGPWVFPPLAKEVLATASRPGSAWGKSSAEDAVRRSLYVHVKRSLREPLLAALDQPDPDLPCAVRFPTNVPTQALLTLNGPFVNGRAKALADSVLEVSDGIVASAVADAISRALARAPMQEEITRAVGFIAELQEQHGLTEHDAMALFALGLFNRNEFLWID